MRPNDLITDAPEYLALASTGPDRRKAYQSFFATPLARELRTRRPDLITGAFLGDLEWVTVRLEACGLSPPS